jgi:hypothetical protein
MSGGVLLVLGPVPVMAFDDVVPSGWRVARVQHGAGGRCGAIEFGELGKALCGSLDRVAGFGGVALGENDQVVVVSFAGGWGLAEAVFSGEDDRITAWVGADSYYAGRARAPRRGHVWMVGRACRGEAVVAFASSEWRERESVGEVRTASTSDSAVGLLFPSGVMLDVEEPELAGPLAGVTREVRGGFQLYRCGVRYRLGDMVGRVLPWMVGEVLAPGRRRIGGESFGEMIGGASACCSRLGKVVLGGFLRA